MSWRNVAKAGTLALFLVGCASAIIEERMQPMVGRPASDVFEKLGLPDAEGEVAGRRFYIWGTQTSGSFTVPQHKTGTIYGPYGTSTYGYTTYQQHFYNYMCTIRVFVDSDDRIATYDFKGNEGGCSTFAEMLSR